MLLLSAKEGAFEDTCMDLENFYVTPCFCHDYPLTLVEYIKQQNTQSVCTTREKETDRDTFFLKKISLVPCCPVSRVPLEL